MSGSLSLSKDIMQAFGALDMFVIVLIGYLWKDLTAKVKSIDSKNKELETSFSNLKLFITENYVSHTSLIEKLNDIIPPIRSSINKLD